MTSQHDKAKRWRPRFSVKTLAIAVTLASCYAACWGPTKRQGVEDVTHRFCREHGFDFTEPIGASNAWLGVLYDVSPKVPLVVAIEGPLIGYGEPSRRHFYFWFFGFVAKLPFE